MIHNVKLPQITSLYIYIINVIQRCYQDRQCPFNVSYK